MFILFENNELKKEKSVESKIKNKKKSQDMLLVKQLLNYSKIYLIKTQ